jgi:hypothetical protein
LIGLAIVAVLRLRMPESLTASGEVNLEKQ